MVYPENTLKSRLPKKSSELKTGFLCQRLYDYIVIRILKLGLPFRGYMEPTESINIEAFLGISVIYGEVRQ